MTLDDLTRDVLAFAKEREWEPFHAPKNLAMAVVTEAAELAEVFQWLTLEESGSLTEKQRAAAQDEIGDVLICLCNLAARVGIDPLAAAAAKLEKNRLKYPVEKARGNARKYDEF